MSDTPALAELRVELDKQRNRDLVNGTTLNPDQLSGLINGYADDIMEVAINAYQKAVDGEMESAKYRITLAVMISAMSEVERLMRESGISTESISES